MEKRTRAWDRYQETKSESVAAGVNLEDWVKGNVEKVGEWLSDEEDVGEEEWRNVRPTGKSRGTRGQCDVGIGADNFHR